MWKMTVDPEEAPDEAQVVEIEYEAGNPVAIDGERLSPAQLLQRANEIAGRHGVGRVDIVENRFVGMKSRGCYETPGGTLLYHAHKAVESLTLDRQVVQLRDELMPRRSEEHTSELQSRGHLVRRLPLDKNTPNTPPTPPR